MKLKRVDFTSTQDKQRHIRALGGYVAQVFVGQQVSTPAWNHFAEVASLELDRQAKLVLMRLAHTQGPDKGKPCRRMTTDQTVQTGQEADCVGLAYVDRAVFYFDDEQKAQPHLPQASQANQDADPPTAKAIQQQGRGR